MKEPWYGYWQSEVVQRFQGREGYKTLDEGEAVTFEIADSDKGPRATNVQRTNG